MRTIEEIYGELTAAYEAAGNVVLRDGGDMALRLRTVAAQIFALEKQLEYSRAQAFPQTAEGMFLDRHAEVRGLQRMGGSCARGRIRFFVEEPAAADIPIEKGVVCTDMSGAQFITTESGQIPVGGLYCEVDCSAREPGELGNVPVGAVCCMPLPPVGVSGCQNPGPMTGGSSGESDESLRQRVLHSYSSLPNGANIAYYEEQAKSVNGVYAVQVLPRRRGVGTVDVIVASQEGIPQQGVLDEVEARLKRQREICVDIAVQAPVEQRVDMTIRLSGEKEAQTKVQEALEAYFDGALLGKSVLLAKLNAIVFGTEGVENCRIAFPEADIPGAEGVLPVLGTVQFTGMEK